MTEFDEDNIRPIDRVRNISRMLFFLFIFLLGIKGLGNGFSLLGGDLLDSIFQVTENPFFGLIRPEQMLSTLSDDPALQEVAKEVEVKTMQMIDDAK